jgi:tetratricopeptide (TPR) repeat protein
MNSKRQLKMTLSIAKPSVLACLMAVSVSAVSPTALADIPSYLHERYAKLNAEGEQNKVLNLMALGKTALIHNDIKEAERAFEAALVEIEAVYANNESATKARSLWHEEGSKNFKGEPYERSMAYFYRGLIYLAQHDFGNAQASFRSGLMQDAFAEEEQHRSDFALMMFLAGWSFQKMGSHLMAEEAFAELKQFRPDFPIPPLNHDTLVIAETGKAPRKLADGLGHYELVFRRGKKIKDKGIELITNKGVMPMYKMEDIYWQASTRGGRPVDSIIQGKANFKKTTAKTGSQLSEASNAALMVGSLGSSTANNIGAAFSLVSVTSLAMSAKTKARADTRYWPNLPDVVHVYSYDSSQQPDVESFNYKDKNNNVLFNKIPEIVSSNEKHTLIWSSNGDSQ